MLSKIYNYKEFMIISIENQWFFLFFFLLGFWMIYVWINLIKKIKKKKQQIKNEKVDNELESLKWIWYHLVWICFYIWIVLLDNITTDLYVFVYVYLKRISVRIFSYTDRIEMAFRRYVYAYGLPNKAYDKMLHHKPEQIEKTQLRF